MQALVSVKSSEERALASIPVEILRIIFEKAMEDEPLPVHLALVSWQVKGWVEPFIYRDLSFNDTRRLNLFLRTWNKRMSSESTKDAMFYQTHVRGFFIRADMNPEDLLEMFVELSGLQHLACTGLCRDPEIVLWILTACSSGGLSSVGRMIADVEEISQSTLPGHGGKDAPPFAHVRRFSSSAWFTPGHFAEEFTFDNPFFHNLTHLDFPFSSEGLLWEGLCHLPNLTHISFNDMVIGLPHVSSGFWEEWITRLLAACPPSVKVIIFWCIDERAYLEYPSDYDDLHILFERLPEEFIAAMSGGPIMSFSQIDPNLYNFLSRLIMGWVDRCAIAASASCDLPMDHPLHDYVLHTSYPRIHEGDWDHPGSSLPKDFWAIGEEMIERRKKVTCT